MKNNYISKNNSYFLNTNNQNLYRWDKITPDSSNGFLPFMEREPKAGDNGYFYTSVPAYQLFLARDKTVAMRSNNYDFPLVLQQYFNTQNRKSNPVIVQLKLKKNL